MFPVMLSLEGRLCLVVGGGEVALRKVRGLLEEGARVSVVAPEAVRPLEDLGRRGRVELQARPYRPGEAAGYTLVFAATDDRAVNRQVFEDCRQAGIWVNVADDPELCSFHLPARVRRPPLEIAVASGGKAPFAVRRLRELLEQHFSAGWGAWIAKAAELRERVRREGLNHSEREEAYDRFFMNTVEPDTVQLRPTPPAAPDGPGLVSLVGAGPGCPGLLTLLARQRLMRAQVVVCDRLAMPALPVDLPETVELLDVGKTAGNHPVPQEKINDLLVRLSREGKRVVRLKGGDPLVFGRGGEEAERLAAEGLPFEVIPGITSGVAVPAFAGIPVTHRREAVRLSLVTAHEAVKKEGGQVKWELLARDPHATIVGYMGVTALRGVVAKLLEAGMDPATPAAMIHRGTTSAQRSVIAELHDLPRAIEREGLKPPGLFVIGPTVAHAERLCWMARKPLAGERIALTHSMARFEHLLEERGAEVIALPRRLTPAARMVLGALPVTACVSARPDEIGDLVAALEPDVSGALLALCAGAQTRRRAGRCGLGRVVEIPAGAGAEALEREITGRRGDGH